MCESRPPRGSKFERTSVLKSDGGTFRYTYQNDLLRRAVQAPLRVVHRKRHGGPWVASDLGQSISVNRSDDASGVRMHSLQGALRLKGTRTKRFQAFVSFWDETNDSALRLLKGAFHRLIGPQAEQVLARHTRAIRAALTTRAQEF